MNSPAPLQTNSVPEWDDFCSEFESRVRVNRTRVDYFKSVYRELESLGIPFIPLKGLDLLFRAYPSLGMREMTDMDILIHPRDVRKVMAYFESKGLTRKPDEGLTYLSADKIINFDIVWDFWYFFSARDRRELWKRLISLNYEGQTIKILHPEDHFIYFVTFVTAHRGVLSPVFNKDVCLFLEKNSLSMDWEKLAARVQSLKLSPYFYHALLYAQESGCALIPKTFTDSLKPKTRVEKRLLQQLKKFVTEKPQPQISYDFTWLGYPGVRGKLKLLREKLLPSPFELEIQRGIKSPAGYLKYLLLHPLYLLRQMFFLR